MEIVSCVRKNDWYVHSDDDGAFNAESEIALITIDIKYDLIFKLACDRFYNKTTDYKLIYKDSEYNQAWNFVVARNGELTKVDTNFDNVMKDEKLETALGNVRINRMFFKTKITTNGKDCTDCEC